MEEIWKPVRGKEEWAEISNLGQIHRFERVIYSGRGHKSKRIQEESWTYGYECGDYLNAGIGGVNKGVHVWVYLTFVGEIPDGLEVNHIDENKHNNRLDNLNLLTRKENCNWGTRNARMAAALKTNEKAKIARAKVAAALSKAVQALDPATMEVVMEFPSTREAQRQGFDHGAVGKCCNGKWKLYKGFIWRFAV